MPGSREGGFALSIAGNSDRISEPRLINGVCCPNCGEKPADLGPCRPFVETSAIPEDREIAESLSPGHLYFCDACGIGCREPYLDDAQAELIYQSMPLRHWQYEHAKPTAWSMVSRELEKNAGRIVDVGCFDGQFLCGLTDDWRKCAIEPNREAVRKLTSLGILTLGGSTAEVLPEHAGSFDVVTLFDVFEHVAAPWQLLDECMELLKPGGVLFVSTGNCRHWSWKTLKGDHPYLESYRHIRFGSESFFQRWAQTRGIPNIRMMAVSHKTGSITKRIREAMEILYFRGRQRKNIFRLLVHLLHRLPSGQSWLHKRHAGTITALRDHLLIRIVRPKTGGSA